MEVVRGKIFTARIASFLLRVALLLCPKIHETVMKKLAILTFQL
jgi:hypothetical protein